MRKITFIFTILIAMAINTNAQWTVLPSGKTNDFLSVYFIDANNGFVVGDDLMGSGSMIMKTTDGGTTWTQQVISNTYSILN